MRESVIYRLSNEEDVKQLKMIWSEAYPGDDESADIFFDTVYRSGLGVVAEENGTLQSSIFMLPGYYFHIPGQHSKRVTYLFALGTVHTARGKGYGGKTIWKSGVQSYLSGSDYVCFLPAEPSLYLWYSDILGTRTVFKRKEFSGTIQNPFKHTSELISPQLYGNLREKFLSGTPHIELPSEILQLQYDYCKLFGGNFYRVVVDGNVCIAATEQDDGLLIIKELLTTYSDYRKAAEMLTMSLSKQAYKCCIPAFYMCEGAQLVDDNVLVPGGMRFPHTDVLPYWGLSLN